MALNVNRRVKLFYSEADYLAFLESERQKADAGTLELYETTVCCITHGDTAAPDEYLPSHDAGDEDKIFHYNEDDDIRYIPFVNPMWTMHGVSVVPDSIGGFKPKIVVSGSPLSSLPSVIDGQQFTTIDEDFFSGVRSFPEFSIINVEKLSMPNFFSASSSYSFPSHWPSLKTISLCYYYEFEGDTLDAPLLESFSAATHVLDLPVVQSSSLKSITLSLPYVANQLDINDYFPDCSVLESLSVCSSHSVSTSGYSSFSYEGKGVTMTEMVLRSDMSDIRPVSMRMVATDTGGVNTIQNLGLQCDFHGSTFSGVDKVTGGLFVAGCKSTAQETESFGDIISHSEGELSVLLSAAHCTVSTVYIADNQFDSINISGPMPASMTMNFACNRNGVGIMPSDIALSLTSIPTSRPNLTIDVTNNSGVYDNPELHMTFPQDLDYELGTVNISNAKDFSFPNGVRAQTINLTNTVASVQQHWYRTTIYTTAKSAHLNSFIIHESSSPNTGYEVDANVDTLHVIYTSVVAITITVNAEISSAVIDIPSGTTNYRYARLTIYSGVSSATVELLLAQFEPIVSLEPVTGGDSSIRMPMSTYNALASASQAIVYMFKTVYLEEDE